MKLERKVAIITGGNSGIGRATSLLFAKEGAKVIIAAKDGRKGAEVVREVNRGNGEAFFVKTDVSKRGDVQALVKKAVEVHGRIDILFNNAAISPIGTILTTSEKLWQSVIDVNLTGTFLCTKYVLPYMLKQGGGVIINTGSINSLMAMKDEAAYDASKGGVLMLTRATAMDFALNNIRANCICPAAIDTPMLRDILGQAPDPKQAESDMIKRHALGRVGTPDEVARVALFLASDDSSFITGSAVGVDGGMLGGWV